MSKTPYIPDLYHELNLTCDCGSNRTVSLRHWDKLYCSCGLGWIVLQPKKGGPMRLMALNSNQNHTMANGDTRAMDAALEGKKGLE